MTKIKLRHISKFKDRHGKQRYYFRRGRERQVPLPGLPGSPEFMAAYQAALDGKGETVPSAKAPARGTIAALVESYYGSADFKQLRDSTKTTYRGIIERFRAEHGHRTVAGVTTKVVFALVDKKSDTPAAANNFLRILHLLMRHAIEREWRKDDPTVGVRKIKHSSQGFATWTEAEIAQYEKHHPIGSRERLAFALLLYTGARRSDMVKLGWQHFQQRPDGDRLEFKQQKTSGRVSVPIHPKLAEVLAAVPRTNMTFLLTTFGRPFCAAGFGNWFRGACQEARIPAGRSAHGLRKAIARRLAEAGCTPFQIASITGHSTLKEVERYTREASRDDLAQDAIASLWSK